MPGKKKAGKKKKKGGKKKRPKGMLEDPGVVVKRLYKSYLDNCAKKKSVVCPRLKSSMKDCYENDRLIVKVQNRSVYTDCSELSNTTINVI